MFVQTVAVAIPLYATLTFSQVGFLKGLERTVMLEYRMYVIDNSGKIIERIDLECPNDAEAVSDGKTYLQKNNVEIWCGQRVVSVLHPLT